MKYTADFHPSQRTRAPSGEPPLLTAGVAVTVGCCGKEDRDSDELDLGDVRSLLSV